jgi:hypothetical protein
MKLWQHLSDERLEWHEEQPNEEWYSVPTMYEDEIRSGITDEQYAAWFEQSAVISGVRMGPRIKELTKTHDSPMVTAMSELSPANSEWIVGFLPGGGGLILRCSDCDALWDGRRAIWSKAECDKKP